MAESISFEYVRLFETLGYDQTNYLAELLSPLSQLECTFKNSKKIVERICRTEVRDCYMVVSFDEEPLFSNMPFIRTIVPYSERIN